jgi:hypothetical protein
VPVRRDVLRPVVPDARVYVDVHAAEVGLRGAERQADEGEPQPRLPGAAREFAGERDRVRVRGRVGVEVGKVATAG